MNTMKRQIKRLPLDPETSSWGDINRANKKERMVAAMKKHLGVIYYACQTAGITRATHYKWMRQDPKYREQIEDAGLKVGDFVEHKVLEGIQKGNTAMTIFYCKTKLKHRGYVERHEVTGADGGDLKLAGDLTVTQAMGELPPAAIADIIKGIVGSSGRAEEAIARIAKR